MTHPFGSACASDTNPRTNCFPRFASAWLEHFLRSRLSCLPIPEDLMTSGVSLALALSSWSYKSRMSSSGCSGTCTRKRVWSVKTRRRTRLGEEKKEKEEEKEEKENHSSNNNLSKQPTTRTDRVVAAVQFCSCFCQCTDVG